ncbi:hypothetical protein B0H19DRAFT_1274243 [Mycena capillaripes]|nr:hypothetical protein B0H19DRAFT_1274243 [Mycena capillaripes]
MLSLWVSAQPDDVLAATLRPPGLLVSPHTLHSPAALLLVSILTHGPQTRSGPSRRLFQARTVLGETFGSKKARVAICSRKRHLTLTHTNASARATTTFELQRWNAPSSSQFTRTIGSGISVARDEFALLQKATQTAPSSRSSAALPATTVPHLICYHAPAISTSAFTCWRLLRTIVFAHGDGIASRLELGVTLVPNALFEAL